VTDIDNSAHSAPAGHAFQSYFPDSGSVDLHRLRRRTIDRRRPSTSCANSRPATRRPRSALLPMLHLVQSVDGRMSPARRPGLRRRAGNLNCSGVRGGDLLHDVPPSSGREASRGGLRHRALRRHGRRRAHGARRGQARHPPPVRRPPTAPSASSGRRMQRGLRLRAGHDGQLGVHGQHDPREGRPSCWTTWARGKPVDLDPWRRPSPAGSEAERVHRGLPRRACRRGPHRRRGVHRWWACGSPTTRGWGPGRPSPGAAQEEK
jgi:hypothetical protein